MHRRGWIVIVIVAIGMASLAACSGAAHADPPTGSTEAAVDTPDGEHLAATVIGTGPIGIVAVHGYNADRSHWFGPAAQIAAQADATVFAVDLRGYGTSTGKKATQQDVDVLAAVAWVRAHGHTHVFVMGSSMGATSALVAASETDLDGVVALSPPTHSFAMDASAAAPRISEPTLLVAAEKNHPFDRTTQTLAAALGTDAVILSGSRHGTGMFTDHPDLVARIVAFVRSPPR